MVFEPGRSMLWVCGHAVVQAYCWSASAERFSCERALEITLPSDRAHDLMSDPVGGGLIVTTADKVWRLDPRRNAITPFAPIADVNHVKGVSVDAASGIIAYITGIDASTWWNDHLILLRRDGTTERRTIPGRRLYKVRWDQPCRLESEG